MDYFLSLGADAAPEILKAALGAALALIGRAILNFLKDRLRYGGWSVLVLGQDGQELCKRAVGARKAEEVMDDLTSLSVFLKGVASPFGWLTIDVVSQEAQRIGLLKTDKKGRTWTVDLSKNPPKNPPGGPAGK